MKLTWHQFEYNGNSADTHITKIRKKFDSESASKCLSDDRTTYVIETLPPFSLAYPLKPSPVVYIGKGVFWNRLSQSHSKWIKAIHQKLGVRFQASVCCPRKQKFEIAFEQVEADLIQSFVAKFGTLLLMNSRKEWPKKKWSYDKWSSRVPLREVDETYYCSLSLFDALFDLEGA
jgi:hypothetical protein